MIALTRHHDWERRLRLAIDARRALPFAWGHVDCALYAADLVAATTGEDFGAPFRGLYSDEPGALALMAAHGWSDLAKLAGAHLPARDAPPRRGDVVLTTGQAGRCLTISLGGGRVIGPGPRRPQVWRAVEAAACWSVG